MRLAASLRYSLYFVSALLFASGAAWVVLHYLQESFSKSAETNLMRVHGGAAMAILVLVGAAAALHSTKSWREGKNRLTGVGLGVTLIALTLTGYLLYYEGDEATRAAASVLHWAIGLAAPFLFACHAWLGRRVVQRDTATSAIPSSQG